jgi:HAE1 family hydrophobic/amphiphilic exporter-1
MMGFLIAFGCCSLLSAQTSNQKSAPSSAQTSAAVGAAVDTFVEKADKNGTALRMSLKDAMKIALQNNLNIAIQDYSEEISRQKIFAAQYVYEPRFVGSFGFGAVDNPNTTIFNQALGGNSSTAKSLLWSGGIVQNLPYGGNWKLDYTTNRTSLFPVTNAALFTSQYRGGLSLTFTQPLIRDFRNNQAFQRIKLAKLDDKISDTQFEQQVTTVVKQVQDLYWELLFAIKDQQIKKKSLELARVQLDNNKRKVEIGTLAPISITEASAEVANREQAMIAAENQINNMQNQLKRALSNDRSSDIWNKSIIPTENADFIPTNFDMQESIATAIKNRPELRQVQLGLEQVDVNYQYFKNQRKPKFDLVAAVGTNGTAGSPVIRPFNPPADCATENPRRPDLCVPPPPLSPEFRGSLGRLFSQLLGTHYSSYSLTVQVDIPLRNRSLDAQLAQTSLQRRQTLKQLKDTEQMVLVDVRNALQAIETNKKVVQTSQVAVQLSKEQLEGEDKKFQAGLSTTFFVLQRQADLAGAEGRLLRAIVDYRKSIHDLQKATFVTLDANDMELAKSQQASSKD